MMPSKLPFLASFGQLQWCTCCNVVPVQWFTAVMVYFYNIVSLHWQTRFTVSIVAMVSMLYCVYCCNGKNVKLCVLLQ